MQENRPEAYVRFLAHYHGDRDFFECHELLEEYWKAHPESPFRQTWAVLIQAAVGMYHHRRGNAAGAVKSFEGAMRKWEPEQLRELGIDAAAWRRRLEEAAEAARAGSPYRDVDIPLADGRLEAQARQLCEQATGAPWGSPSRMDDLELLHRHARRDRTDVIEARQASLARRGGR